MDNLDTIKFKEQEIPGLWYKIDIGTGRKTSFSQLHGYHKEMLKWIEAGNVLEPPYTPAELAQKDAADLQSSLESQKSQCIQLLRKTLHTQSDDFDYPDDKGTWKEYRDLVKIVMRSEQIETIPDKPTF